MSFCHKILVAKYIKFATEPILVVKNVGRSLKYLTAMVFPTKLIFGEKNDIFCYQMLVAKFCDRNYQSVNLVVKYIIFC